MTRKRCIAKPLHSIRPSRMLITIWASSCARSVSHTTPSSHSGRPSIQAGGAAHHLHLGVALRRQSKFGDAEMAHRQAIALDPGYGDAYINLGDVLRCLGRLNESESVLRHAIGLRPQSADAFQNWKNAWGAGETRRSGSACRQAVALDPNNGRVLRPRDRVREPGRTYRGSSCLPTRHRAQPEICRGV